jgi:hypothetical protein
VGRYEKSHDEDFKSIVKGLQGKKGKVALHFSEPLALDSNVPEHWSSAIDDSIHNHYHLFENNHFAMRLLQNNDELSDDALKTQTQNKLAYIWSKRFKSVPKDVMNNIKQYYAQPVMLKNKTEKNDAQ